MVINVGALRSGDHEAVKHDIRQVVEVAHGGGAIGQGDSGNGAARRQPEGRGLHAGEAGGRGFRQDLHRLRPAGATAHDVALMRGVVGPEMGVKAAGGIRTLEDLRAMTAAGATRIGASASVKIVEATAA